MIALADTRGQLPPSPRDHKKGKREKGEEKRREKKEKGKK